MSRRLVVGTGWKMNNGAAGTARYAAVLAARLSPMDLGSVDIFVMPPFSPCTPPRPRSRDPRSASAGRICTILRRHGIAAAAATRIIYRGAVTTQNASALIRLPDVDGLFVGRAAWSPEGLAEVVALVAGAAIEKEKTA